MNDAATEFYIKSMTQRTKDLDDAYDRIHALEKRNVVLERVLSAARSHTTHLECVNSGGMRCKYCELREAISAADAKGAEG